MAVGAVMPTATRLVRRRRWCVWSQSLPSLWCGAPRPLTAEDTRCSVRSVGQKRGRPAAHAADGLRRTDRQHPSIRQRHLIVGDASVGRAATATIVHSWRQRRRYSRRHHLGRAAINSVAPEEARVRHAFRAARDGVEPIECHATDHGHLRRALASRSTAKKANHGCCGSAAPGTRSRPPRLAGAHARRPQGMSTPPTLAHLHPPLTFPPPHRQPRRARHAVRLSAASPRVVHRRRRASLSWVSR